LATKPLAWKTGSFGDEGALSAAHRSKLAERFGIEDRQLIDLSSMLAFALNPKTFIPCMATYRKQQRKGALELEKIITDLRLAEYKLKAAERRLMSLHINYPRTDIRPDDPQETYASMLFEARISVQTVLRSFTRSATKFGVNSTEGPDKRKVRDNRRQLVLNQVFRFWASIGRPVTITTAVSTSKRTGPLVDFVNAVVGFTTEPQAQLNGETIWAEIKAWKTNEKRFASVSIEDKNLDLAT
jgi:hypothetical protein